MEVYKESKHGILYEAFRDKLNMDRPAWVVGKDYTTAPTCSTCHLERHAGLRRDPTTSGSG